MATTINPIIEPFRGKLIYLDQLLEKVYTAEDFNRYLKGLQVITFPNKRNGRSGGLTLLKSFYIFDSIDRSWYNTDEQDANILVESFADNSVGKLNVREQLFIPNEPHFYQNLTERCWITYDEPKFKSSNSPWAWSTPI